MISLEFVLQNIRNFTSTKDLKEDWKSKKSSVRSENSVFHKKEGRNFKSFKHDFSDFFSMSGCVVRNFRHENWMFFSVRMKTFVQSVFPNLFNNIPICNFITIRTFEPNKTKKRKLIFCVKSDYEEQKKVKRVNNCV